PNFGIDGCPGVRPPVASVGESEAPSTPTESAKSLRKRPLFHLAGRAPLPARKTPSRVIALSPMQSRAVRRVGDECDRLQRRAIRATRAGASRGRMPETPREQVSALPAVGTGPRQGTVAATPRPLCYVSSRGDSPSGASQPTNATALPERSRPVVGLPPPGTGSTGRLAPLRLQVRFEERQDASPCIARAFLVVARSWREYSEDRLQDSERERRLVSSSFMVVEKG